MRLAYPAISDTKLAKIRIFRYVALECGQAESFPLRGGIHISPTKQETHHG